MRKMNSLKNLQVGLHRSKSVRSKLRVQSKACTLKFKRNLKRALNIECAKKRALKEHALKKLKKVWAKNSVRSKKRAL